MAQVHLLVLASGAEGDAADEYRGILAQVSAALGADFAQRYDVGVRRKVEQEQAAQATQLARAQRQLERAEVGEALISEAELVTFLASDRGLLVLNGLQPELRASLELELENIDESRLPRDDLARHLKEAAKR